MRKLSLLCMNTLLSDIEDCHTKNYVKIHIDSEETLSRLNYRWYKFNKKEEKCIDEDFDKHLIGKTLRFRSPITCNSEDGKICKKCYGKLSLINNNIHIGILGIEILSSHLTQMMLSAKHLLKTSSETINWSPEFLKIFSTDSNAIVINPFLENENKYTMIIDENNISESEDFITDDDELGFTKSIKNISIVYINQKNKEVTEIITEKELFLSPYFEDLIKTYYDKDESKYNIPLKSIDPNEVLFYIEIENNELSKHLYNILSLTDNKDHLGVTNKDEMMQKFIELLNESRIPVNSVHVECIVRELLRKPDDITQRPDFSQLNPDYRILRVSEAIMNSPSIITSLSFEKIKKQFFEPETYKKTANSFLDYFFITERMD